MGSGRFREGSGKVPGMFREVPGGSRRFREGSGRFRKVPEGSERFWVRSGKVLGRQQVGSGKVPGRSVVACIFSYLLVFVSIR